jgi:hypothetical protein
VSEQDYVEVYAPPGEQREVARQLLEAAGDDRDRVETVTGGFRVPAGVAEAAGLSPSEGGSVDAAAAGRTTEGSAEVGGYADRLIAEEVERGRATAESVGAVFRQNAPNPEAAELDANRDEDDQDGARGAAETEVRADDVVATGAEEQQQATSQESTSQESAQGGQQRDEADLHGRELEEALEAEGLPKSGTVAEKQARLAAHRASQGSRSRG